MRRVSFSLSARAAKRERERGIGGETEEGKGWGLETVHEENIDAFRLEHDIFFLTYVDSYQIQFS